MALILFFVSRQPLMLQTLSIVPIDNYAHIVYTGI
jgi:hypothetical protein